MSAALAIQAAAFARLSAALAPIKVYDAVPQGAAYPYVALGDDTQIDWSSKGASGHEHTLTFHAWSRYAGRKEAKELLGKVVAALGTRLALDGHWNVDIYPEFETTLLDEDGQTYHGVIRFRALTHTL